MSGRGAEGEHPLVVGGVQGRHRKPAHATHGSA